MKEPTKTTDLCPGCKVKLSAYAIANNVRAQANKKYPGQLATVIQRWGDKVQVVWDGTKTPQWYHRDFVEGIEHGI